MESHRHTAYMCRVLYIVTHGVTPAHCMYVSGAHAVECSASAFGLWGLAGGVVHGGFHERAGRPKEEQAAASTMAGTAPREGSTEAGNGKRLFCHPPSWHGVSSTFLVARHRLFYLFKV